MLGGFLYICSCTCTIYCDLWPLVIQASITLTWYQSRRVFFSSQPQPPPALASCRRARSPPLPLPRPVPAHHRHHRHLLPRVLTIATSCAGSCSRASRLVRRSAAGSFRPLPRAVRCLAVRRPAVRRLAVRRPVRRPAGLCPVVCPLPRPPFGCCVREADDFDLI